MTALRRRLERITRDFEQPTVTNAEMCALLKGLASAVRRHVTDPTTLHAIAEDMRRAAASFGEDHG